MKKYFLLHVLFLTIGWSYTSAQIYVNQSATGSSTGVNWYDAYTDLEDALTSATAGEEIWVAAGTYKPGGPGVGNPSSTFLLDKNLKLLGGFAGGETSADDRDPANNLTILSGDLLGDDLADEYLMNRADNVMTVLTVQATVTEETLIDGFTIRNGQADGSGSDASTNGGAIYCEGSPVIRQCVFLQNYSFANGGAVSVDGETARGTQIEDCHFEKNRADGYGGGLSINGPVTVDPEAPVQVSNTSFLSNLNSNGRGGGLSVVNANVQVLDCSFVDNSNEEQGGGMWVYISGGLNYQVEVEDCYFENNRASFGGGFYYLNYGHNATLMFRNSAFIENRVFDMGNGWGQGGGGVCMYIDENTTAASVNFEKCLFNGNTTTVAGGGIRIINNGVGSNFFFKNCDFTRNESVNNGGGISINDFETANQTIISVDSCLFSENTTELWAGSGLRALLSGQNTEFSLSNSRFTQNTVGLAGAAAIYAFNGNSNGQVLVDHCMFEGNYGGNDSGLSLGSATDAGFFEYTISNCDFKSNAADFWGGGAVLYAEVPARFLMEACLFEENIAGEIGGGMYIANTNPETEMVIQNCILRNNESPFGAAIGAIPFTENPNDFAITTEASIRIENCLVYENTGDNAAVALKQTGNVTLMNCTVVDNAAGGLALDTASSVSLQNTILANPDYTEFKVINADHTIVSGDGNLILDNSLDSILSEWDLSGTEPGFEPGTYEPALGSPLVNGGNNVGVTAEHDLAGNPRIQKDIVDIGAYESPFDLVSTYEVIAGGIILSPNPADSYLQIELPHPERTYELVINDARGRTVEAYVSYTGQSFSVVHLARGIYTVSLSDGERMYIGKFVKQ